MGMPPLQRLTTSWIGRTGGIAKLLIGLTGRQAGMKILERLGSRDRAVSAADMERLSEELAAVLGRYKGATMKLGQMMSYMDMLDIPAPVRAALSKLQVASAPLDPAAVAAAFEAEIGMFPDHAFASWTKRPFAAASIGQVHRAELKDGTAVAVKIQYPGIETAIRNDLKSASLIAAVMQPFTGEVDTKASAEEIRARLLEECDYLREADNLERFRALFADRPDVVIPKPHRAFTTKRVLTMDFVRGQSLQTFAQRGSQARRNAAGQTIFSFVWTSILKHYCFNCDPHPGNFLFVADQVVFLDFGCVRTFTPNFVTYWRGLMRAVIEGNEQMHRTYLDALRLTPPREKRDAFDYDYQMRVSRYLHRPWLGGSTFRYSQDYVRESLSLLVTRNPNTMHMRMPPEFVFLNRLQWGLNSILATLGAEANWRDLLLPLLYETSELWPAPQALTETAS